MERVLSQFASHVGGTDGSSDLDEAQELMYEAFECGDPEEQIGLARKAIEVSPDCADAYVMLAEHAGTPREALDLYQQGVAAGERALGPDAFEEYEGHFWGVLETRPYMRAREGLAQVLWTIGRRDEAIDHLLQILRLNPNDNQGVRHTLASWLLTEGHDKEAEVLLQQFQEPSATWSYSKALAAYRRDAESPEARELLDRATKVNPHVPAFLLEEERLPMEQPAYYSLGSAEEAVLYVAQALGAWKTTPGALAWLRAAQPGARARESGNSAKRGPTAAGKARLKRLKQVAATWQADFRQFGPRVQDEGELIQPWYLFVTSPADDLFVAQDVTRDEPSASLIWDVLAGAMIKPFNMKPCRPTVLEVRPDERWQEIEPHLQEVGVKLARVEQFDHLDFVLEGLEEHLRADQPAGLHEIPAVTPPQVIEFYAAAAWFYRQAPWRKLADHTAIKIECESLPGGPWYAVVMGQGGMTFGLTLYEDLRILQRTWSGTGSDEQNAIETVALTVTYDSATFLTDADLSFIEEHSCEVVSRDTYPAIFRKERGMNMRAPVAWELRLMTACLRAIPEFLARHGLGDRVAADVSARVTSQGLDLVLSWIGD
jgi:hypothetical protein